MKISIPKEVKENEYRVAATPDSVYDLVSLGHTVYVESSAGLGSGFTDEDYVKSGAIIIEDTKELWDKCDLIYKVKEPIESEYNYFREGLMIYSYLHLAAEKNLVKELLDKKVTTIAFETVQDEFGLPLLKPMSEVAGRMAVQEGAMYLSKPRGGKGILLQGVPGVVPAHVVIIGAGIVGSGATRMAVGMGARVTVLDVDIKKLEKLCDIFGGAIETLYSNPRNIARKLKNADLVISTVLIPGSRAPKLITEEMVKTMQEGSVIVDVAIDQGGSTEITAKHPTTHSEPIFIKHGVLHYAVTNIPGAVAKTSTHALSNATTKYAKLIANLGLEEAAKKHKDLAAGINTFNGHVTYKGVAESLDLEYKNLFDLI